MSITFAQAEIAQWYTRADKGELFRVVGRDASSRTIEIQSFDGDVDEVDSDGWATLAPEPAEAPEDWTAPMDDIERDDLGYSETEMTVKDWNERLHQRIVVHVRFVSRRNALENTLGAAPLGVARRVARERHLDGHIVLIDVEQSTRFGLHIPPRIDIGSHEFEPPSR